MPGDKANSANNGNAKTGLDKLGSDARAYSPVVVVRKSNKPKKIIEIIIPFTATLHDFAA